MNEYNNLAYVISLEKRIESLENQIKECKDREDMLVYNLQHMRELVSNLVLQNSR